MKRLETLRKEYAPIAALADWQQTLWYPALLALLCAISGSCGWQVYAAVYWIYCAFTVFAALFARDLKVFIPSIFFFYPSLGSDLTPEQLLDRTGSFDSFSTAGLVNFIAAGAIMLVSLIARLIADGVFKSFLKKPDSLLCSILAINAALLLSGILGESPSLENIAYAAFIGLGLTLLFLLYRGMLANSSGAASYLCASALGVSLAATAQVIVRVIRVYPTGALFRYDELGNILEINRDLLQLSWGVATIVGAVIVLGIPAALFLAHKERFGPLYIAAAIVLLFGSAVIDTRSAIVAGALFLIIGALTACFCGKNKKPNRIFCASLLGLTLAAVAVGQLTAGDLGTLWNNIVEFLRFDIISGNQRLLYWRDALNDFLRAPIFGVGFADGVVLEGITHTFSNPFSGMYHSVLLQFLAAAGVVGLAAFLWHCVEIARLLLRRKSASKLFILSVPAMIIAMSLVDNFFFYLNFQIIYAAFLALAQKESLEK